MWEELNIILSYQRPPHLNNIMIKYSLTFLKIDYNDVGIDI